MPHLTNPKHERFALSLAQGKNTTNAYLDAYKVDRKTAGSCGPRLRKDAVNGPLIAARVAELQAVRAQQEEDTRAVAAGAVVISRAWIMNRLQRIADEAVAAGRHSAANKALELLGREIGMFGDRTPADISLDNLSFDDLTKLVAELEADPEVQEELEKRARR
jgi:hypothetical protein